jgi:hypothetical protein
MANVGYPIAVLRDSIDQEVEGIELEDVIAGVIPVLEQLWHVFNVPRSRQRLHLAQRLESRFPSFVEQSNSGLAVLQQELEQICRSFQDAVHVITCERA